MAGRRGEGDGVGGGGGQGGRLSESSTHKRSKTLDGNEYEKDKKEWKKFVGKTFGQKKKDPLKTLPEEQDYAKGPLVAIRPAVKFDSVFYS